MAQEKLTLIMRLSNKLFNSKLSKTQSKFARATDDMGSKVNRLKGRHVAAFSAMRDESTLFSRAMDLLGNPYALVIAGVLALGTVMGKGFMEAKKFNHEFLQIRQLNLDKPAEELANYKELVRDSAFATGKGAQETAKGYYDLQSALGVYGKEAETIFTQVANYSTATGADLGDSINSTSKAMKAFGLDSSQVTQMLESNAKTVQTGITTFDELAKVQTEFGGAAAGANQSVDTANKLFAVFTSIAGDANKASTMTKSAFEGLTQANTVKGLKGIGVNLYDAQGNMRDLGKVLEDVSAKFQGMNPQQIDELIAKIGGPEGLRNLFIKLKTGSEDLFNTIEAFDSSSFDLDKALKNAQGDISVVSDMVGNRFNVIMGKLGDKILPPILYVMEGINKALTLAYNNFDTIEAVLYAAAAGASVFAIQAGIAQLATWGATVASWTWAGSLQAVSKAFFSIPIVGWIAAGVAALVVMYKKWDEFAAVIDTIGELFGDFFGGLWDGAKDVIGGMIDQFMGLGRIIKGIFTGSWDEIKAGGKQAVDGFKRGVGGYGKMIKSGIETTQQVNVGVKYDNNLERIKRERNAEKTAEEDQKSLLADPSGSEQGGSGGNAPNIAGASPGQQVSNVTGAAGQVRNINVQLEALHKGDVNVSNQNTSSMNEEELEQWYIKMGMRAVRGIEMGL